MDERRKFERVNIPSSAKVMAEDRLGKTLGLVRVLGRGGLFVDTQTHFREGSSQTLVIVDEEEGIRRALQAVTRYITPAGVGFEFEKLDPDAAVEIGVIIGKYYSAAKSGQ
jgi:Tfp pilus assembly protein PilZ